MTETDLYRGYIDCLNNQDWPRLHRFVHDEVHYNGDRVGLSDIARCWSGISGTFRTSISTSSS